MKMRFSFTNCAALVFLFASAVVGEEKPALKLSEFEEKIVELTNAERKKLDLPPLKPNAELFAAARKHAANMAKQDKLEHELDGIEFDARIAAEGYKFSAAAENIAFNYQEPKDAVAGWMKSEGHRDNILSKDYGEIGVAVAKNCKGERYWVQVFAARLGK